MNFRILFVLLITLSMTGCSTFFEMTTAQRNESEDSTTELSSEPADDGAFRSDKALEPAEGYGGGMDMDIAESLDEVYAEAPADMIMGTIAPSVAVAGAPVQQVTTLKAGEIDDNANWDDYLIYRRDALESIGDYVNDVDVTGRRIITVVDNDGQPILGATVTVNDGQNLISETRTYANGQTLFLPNANPAYNGSNALIIGVEKDGQTAVYDMSRIRMDGINWQFTLDLQPDRESVKLDVVFLLDATGSMSDEIGQLQQNILSISQQIDAMGDVDVRYGLVHYRDRDDAYVTQVHEFTPDVNAFQKDLNAVRADGGGDTPESLNAGLYDALHNVEWRGNDTIKLVFLVADAPPHLDYPNDYNYAEEMLYASQKGIKIHPIASSGLDAIGEYIFRQIGQTTMGRFIFLTYAGGTPGTAGDERSDLEAGEQDYTVDFLDGLVVRLIEEEITAFKGDQ